MAKSTYQTQLEKAEKEINKLGNFVYKDSGGLNQAYKKLYSDYSRMLDNPENYGYNAYIDDVNDLFSGVMNQSPFSYDPKTDKLFGLYKQQYQNQGKRAMQNQMGVAAANSGGYNSSAAQTSSQRAYQNYMDALSEKAGETYQNALDLYRYNQQNALDKLGAALDMNSAGNDAYFSQANALSDRMNSAYNAYNDARNYQLSKYNSDRSYWQSQGKNALDQINWLKEYSLQKKLYK